MTTKEERPPGKGAAQYTETGHHQNTASLGKSNGVDEIADEILAEAEAAEAAAERRRILEAGAPAIAKRADILAHFADSIRACGQIGEENSARLLYLALTSRLLDRQINVVVKGPSSGGKNFLIQNVVRHFPEEAYVARTGGSSKSAAYMNESLSHRMLILYEANFLKDAEAAYMIRSLLSEGRIVHETVDRIGNKGMAARTITQEGPTGLITSTVAVNLEPEIETRLLSLSITDTAAQTRAILDAMADETRVEPDLTEWQDFQRWLAIASEGFTVRVPFGVALLSLVPEKAVRLRRDARQLLLLIQAHALIHRETRGRDDQGNILADIRDYAAIRPLINHIMSEGVDTSVSEETVQTVKAVASILSASTEQDPEASASQIKPLLGLDKSVVSRRVKKAIAQGYLTNREDRRGKPQRLVLGDPLPENLSILPEPDQVVLKVIEATDAPVAMTA